MVWLSGLPLTTAWLLTSLVIYAGVALTAICVYAPTFQRQTALVEEEGLESRAYQRTARRAAALGISITVLAIAIVFLMVVKPPLWA